MWVVDFDGERYAVYGYDGSYPYTLTTDDWLERIDGKRLPKRTEHYVCDISGASISAGRNYSANEWEALIEDVQANFLEDEMNLPDKRVKQIVKAWRKLQRGFLNQVDELMFSIKEGFVFHITKCDCAGHDFKHHFE